MCTLAACVLWLVASAAAEKPTVRPEPAPALTGTVTDTAGKPVVGALVLARSARHPGDPPLSSRTDDAGDFRLTPAFSGPMDVRVEAAHFAPQELKAQQPGRPLQIRLTAGAWIGGVVRDGSTKAPIEGARVQAWAPKAGGPWDPKASLLETRTDAQGQFRLEGLGPGRQYLRATARGYTAQSEPSARPGTSVSFFLAPGASVVGRVRDGQDRPLAGAVVDVESVRSGVGFQPAGRPEETDTQGHFEVLGLQPGEYRLTARHRELAPAVTTITLARGAVEQVDLVLRPGVEVAGRLVDAEERPVRGSVALAEVDGEAAPSTVAEVSNSLAGDDGRFKMAHVPVGRQVLAVVASGFTPLRVDVTVGTSPFDVGDVRLETGLVIQGRVVDAGGTPVSEAELKAAPAVLERKTYDESPDRTARSDGSGCFLIGGLGEGTYEVTVEAFGFGRTVKPINAGTKNVMLALEPGGSITGQVVDEGGRPLTDYRVVAQVKRSEDDRRGFQRPYSQTVTADDGRFTIDTVAATTYVLDVGSAEYESASVDDVAVRSGAATDVGRVVLRAGGVVRGTVVDGGDVPVAGAEVTAQPRSFLHFVRPPRTTTDGEGAFVLRGLATGTAEVTVSHPSYAEGSTGRIDVNPARGPTEVRIVLGQGARVQGSVQKRDGSPVPEVTIVVHPLGGTPHPPPYMAETGPDGSFAIERVPPGQATVFLMNDAGAVKTSSQARTIDVQEAQVATVDFVLRDIRISGVVLRQQAPIPNASVRFLAPGAGGGMMTSGGSASAFGAVGPARNTGVTGPDGRFELLLDGPGTYGVFVSPTDGQTTHVHSVEIPDVDSRDIEIDLGGTVLSGVVLEETTERPLPAAQLTFHGGSGVVSAETDANGRFQVDLAPGHYSISATLPEFAPEYLELEVPAPGETHILLRRGDSLQGRVVDVAGRGAADVTVRAFSVQPERPLSAQSAADGSFRLTGLRREAYTLLADAGTSLRFAVAAGVQPGDSDVVLALRPAARLLVHVLAPDGKPVAGAHAQVEGIDGARVLYGVGKESDEAGLIEMAAPAGQAELHVFEEMLSGKARVVAGPGATTAVDVRLGPAQP